MSKTTMIFAAVFILAHLMLIAPFVPVMNILPAGFGALSMSSMAITLILAARWRLVDRIMGGPDKSYVAHRWLGFFALAGALGHWALASSVGTGVLPLLAESGEDVGNLAVLGLIVLTSAAMVRFIPYHLWKASHMLMGPIFLLAVYHTFFAASPLAVGFAPWILMATVSAIGIVAWGQTLYRKYEPTRLVEVESAKPFDGGVDVVLRADTPILPYKPGQFATLAYSKARSEPHPFSIAGGDGAIRRFIIRSAGDWTDEFVRSVRVGDKLRLGSGVGRFLPQTKAKRRAQLWVAGGVGITPFLAALERMHPDENAAVNLIYCIRSRSSAGGLDDVEEHARRLPQVNLFVMGDEGKNRLNESNLTAIVQDMPGSATAYVCGPEGLKTLVTSVWKAQGMNGRVHEERFDFRSAYGLTELIYIGKPVLDAAKGVLRASENAAN